MWEKGEEIGLSGDALQMFRHALDEVEMELEVNMTTGLARIVGVNGNPVEARDGR